MTNDDIPPVKIDLSTGTPNISLEGITRISILNIPEVRSHRIMREGENNIHHIEFLNGGTAKIVYEKNGKLLEFSCKQVEVSIDNGTEITLKMMSKNI